MNTRQFFRNTLLLLSLILAVPQLQAQFYNLSTDIHDQDIARNVEYDPLDGGHATTGYSEIAVAGGGISANLVKYDFTGATVWSRLYDFGTGLSRGNDVEKTSDGGYIIAGHGINPATGVASALVIKTDPLGGVMWSQFYDFAGSTSEAFAVEEVFLPLIGPNYILTGSFKNPASGTMDIFAILTGPFGGIIAQSQFDTGFDEEAYDIKPGPGFAAGVGPAYVLTGYSTFGGPGPKNVLVCGLDFGLAMLFGEVYGGPRDEEGRAIEVSPIGDLLVAGWSNSFSNGKRDVFVSMLTPFGAPIWQNIYGVKRDEEAFSTEFISDGTIAVTGWTNQLSSTGSKDAFLFKTNLAGVLLFSRAYGGPLDDIGYSIKESISVAGVAGELLMAGVYAEDPSAVIDDRDIYTVRTNAAGVAPCARNPKFRQLPVVTPVNTFILPANMIALNFNIPPFDPFIPNIQKDRCCTCADMVVSYVVSPTFFCSGVPVTFTNTSDCIDAYRWLVNGTLVSTATDLVYVFPAPGIYTVTLMGSLAGCPVVSYSQTFSVTCGPAPRLEEEQTAAQIQLAPNPAQHEVLIQAELGESAEATAIIQVMDITGRVVYEGQSAVESGAVRMLLPTADWNEGLYLVRVSSGQAERTERLMIAR